MVINIPGLTLIQLRKLVTDILEMDKMRARSTYIRDPCFIWLTYYHHHYYYYYYYYYYYGIIIIIIIIIIGGEGWLGFLDLLSGQKPWWNWLFNPCGEFQWRPEGPVSQIHSPHLHFGAPGIFSDLLRFVQQLKKERGVWKATESYCTYSIPGKTAAFVPAFGRTAT